MSDQQPSKKRRLTRRGFLIGAGVASTGLVVGVPLGLPVFRLKVAEMFADSAPSGGEAADPFAWFEIRPDDTVRLLVPKVEMGQGVHTALAQIAAEELDLPWDRLTVQQGSTHQGPPEGTGTVGSTSVAALYTPIRKGAAMLREMLRTEAARRLEHPAADLVAREGGFEAAADPSVRITYGTLVSEAVDWVVPEAEPALKADSDLRYIGKAMPRVDLLDKVTGKAVYGYDVRAEGMLYGAVARPPTLEATMIAAAPGDAPGMPGVVQVVIQEGFAGVVARSRAEAAAARDRLAIVWDEGHRWQQEEIDAIVTVGNGTDVVIQREGDTDDYLDDAYTAEYRTPFAVQTPLEPQAALADVRDGKARLWVSTQLMNFSRNAVADALGMDAENVEVTATSLGGGFGRKGGNDVGVEAARLSQAVGAPVHVGWSRTEELRYGHFRPPTHNRLRGALDGNGRLVALEHQQASGDVLFGLMPGIVAAVLGADLGAWRGTPIIYGIPNRRAVAYRTKIPVPTGPWRGLGLFANTFALESFMDEMAHHAGADPLQFRLDHVADDVNGQRLRAVLEAVRDASGWGGALPEGHARGVACCIDVDTLVAQVAEVSVDADSGQIHVHRVTAAMDCGRVINPDGARAQVEGNIVWGVGSTLLEEMRVKDGKVDLTNFDRYPLLTIGAAPEIDTVLLEAPDGIPRGVGEPAIGPTGAAIANAVYVATGTRLRQLPLTPARVKAALSSTGAPPGA